MSTVAIRNLTKVHGATPVVRGVDLDIGDGELLVVVGPSGCGKTSLLRMVASLEPITSGEVIVDGRVVNDIKSNDRDLAMMFQEPALYPHMTVEQNLAFPLRMAGERRHEVDRRVGEIAELLDVSSLLHRRPSKLSGGQQQRVAMGRALIRRPALLLMDEPMSNLDAKLRTELRAAIGHLQQRLGITTLYVTHDQVEAMSLGHRIAVMREGRIVQCAPPQELYDHPVDAFVGQFMGSPPMNLVLGHIERGELRVGATPVLDDVSSRAPDGDVVVGIRPHDLGVARDGVGIPADVTAVETAGDRVELTATIGAGQIALAADGMPHVADRTASLSIEAPAHAEFDDRRWQATYLVARRVHLFDLGSGAALDIAPATV